MLKGPTSSELNGVEASVSEEEEHGQKDGQEAVRDAQGTYKQQALPEGWGSCRAWRGDSRSESAVSKVEPGLSSLLCKKLESLGTFV